MICNVYVTKTSPLRLKTLTFLSKKLHIVTKVSQFVGKMQRN